MTNTCSLLRKAWTGAVSAGDVCPGIRGHKRHDAHEGDDVCGPHHYTLRTTRERA